MFLKNKVLKHLDYLHFIRVCYVSWESINFEILSLSFFGVAIHTQSFLLNKQPTNENDPVLYFKFGFRSNNNRNIKTPSCKPSS